MNNIIKLNNERRSLNTDNYSAFGEKQESNLKDS